MSTYLASKIILNVVIPLELKSHLQTKDPNHKIVLKTWVKLPWRQSLWNVGNSIPPSVQISQPSTFRTELVHGLFPALVFLKKRSDSGESKMAAVVGGRKDRYW